MISVNRLVVSTEKEDVKKAEPKKKKKITTAYSNPIYITKFNEKYKKKCDEKQIAANKSYSISLKPNGIFAMQKFTKTHRKYILLLYYNSINKRL